MSGEQYRPDEDALGAAVRALREAAAPPGPGAETLQVVLAAGESWAGNLRAPQRKRKATTMKTLMKIAAVAVLAAGLAGLVYVLTPGNGGGISRPAFAQVVEPLVSARNGSFTMILEMPGQPKQTARTVFAENGVMRTIMETPAGPMTQFFDMPQRRMVMLMPPQKMAIVMEMQNLPQADQDLSKVNMFFEIQRQIRRAQQQTDENVQYLGEQVVEGVEAVGYHVRQGPMDMTVWANARTALPIRMEVAFDQALMGGEAPMSLVMTDFAFNLDLDPAEFTAAIPQDYQVSTMPFDASVPDENALIESFQMWLELTNGRFPDDLSIQAIAKGIAPRIAMRIGAKVLGAKLLGARQVGASILDQEDMQKIMGLTMRLTRGFMFVHSLPAESDWHYAGKGVTTADEVQAIFWYRPKDSINYRVIYSDLTVAEAPAEQAPQVEGAQEGGGAAAADEPAQPETEEAAPASP